MSAWTHIVGTIYVDTNKEFEKKEDLKQYIENKLKDAPQITGSESNADYFVNILSGYNVSSSAIEQRAIVNKEYQTCAVITIVGDLRDRVLEQTKVEVELFVDYIKDMIGIVLYNAITIDDSIDKTYINIEEE